MRMTLMTGPVLRNHRGSVPVSVLPYTAVSSRMSRICLKYGRNTAGEWLLYNC